MERRQKDGAIFSLINTRSLYLTEKRIDEMQKKISGAIIKGKGKKGENMN
jgi:hypothetical protein